MAVTWRVTWPQLLGWRSARQGLDPIATGDVGDVVAAMGALPAWPDAAAELAVGARRSAGHTGDVAAAIAAGHIVKVYAFRGATHLMVPQHAGEFLAVRASSRQWELTSWQTHYRLPSEQWPRFRAYVRDAVTERPLTRGELAAALARSSRYRHLSQTVAEGNDTLLKPLFWQGDVCFGPPHDGEVTLQRLDGIPGWAGLPDVDVAGPRVIDSYLRVHGPARLEQIRTWVGDALGGRRRAVDRWLGDLAERSSLVRVAGENLVVLSADLASVETARPSAAVRLLPGRDPWVMGPGTADAQVVPPAHREPVSRTANIIIYRGVVGGVWALRGEQMRVTSFADAGRMPRAGLAGEVERLSAFLGRSLDLTFA